jgi:hypothetical protein
MASSKKSSTKKVHLTRPTNERRAMCGKSSNIEETDKPKLVTCVTCTAMYEKNKNWFSQQKRKQTIAAKQAASAISPA